MPPHCKYDEAGRIAQDTWYRMKTVRHTWTHSPTVICVGLGLVVVPTRASADFVATRVRREKLMTESMARLSIFPFNSKPLYTVSNAVLIVTSLELMIKSPNCIPFPMDVAAVETSVSRGIYAAQPEDSRFRKENRIGDVSALYLRGKRSEVAENDSLRREDAKLELREPKKRHGTEKEARRERSWLPSINDLGSSGPTCLRWDRP